MQIGTSGPHSKGIKWLTLEVRRSKVRVIQRQNRLKIFLSVRFVKNYPTKFNQTWHAHIMVNAHCVTTVEFKGQR